MVITMTPNNVNDQIVKATIKGDTATVRSLLCAHRANPNYLEHEAIRVAYRNGFKGILFLLFNDPRLDASVRAYKPLLLEETEHVSVRKICKTFQEIRPLEHEIIAMIDFCQKKNRQDATEFYQRMLQLCRD